MKNVLKKNQIMITALAIMIAVAGYLNFAGTKIGDEAVSTAGTGQTAEEDMTALLDLSDEDTLSDIESLDSDPVEAEDYLSTDMQEAAVADTNDASSDVAGMELADAGAEVLIATDGMDEASAEAMSDNTELPDSEVPGEAVFTSASNVATLSGAKLLKEQTRAKNKETLLEIINNANISETQKQEAVDGMIALTDMAEKETSAEILLEAKGFSDVVVSISGTGVDVVVGAAALTDAQRAQIEDVVKRKTGIAAENIIISPITSN